MMVFEAVMKGVVEVLLRGLSCKGDACPAEVALIGVSGCVCVVDDGVPRRVLDVVLDVGDESLESCEVAEFAY